MTQKHDLEALQRLFKVHEEDCRDYSPLYQHLCHSIVDDPEMLRIADYADGSMPPNLIFASVQYLLLSGIEHPLRRYYPSLVSDPLPPAGAYSDFRDFCLRHEAEVARLMTTRITQTNEVNRSTCLLPAFSYASTMADDAPLALVDIGASAGLNLLIDRFHIDYGSQQWGDPESPVHLRCELRGERALPIQQGKPAIGYRVGIDINPIDIANPDELLWLRSLVWPEHRERVERLEGAARLAEQHPPSVLRGSVLDLLPDVAAGAPKDTVLCLYHAFVLYQLSSEERQRFHELVEKVARQRPTFLISMQGAMQQSYVDLDWWINGRTGHVRLAETMAHGGWIRWLAER